jgi:hypothetical protein
VITGNSQEIFCLRKQNGSVYQYYRKKLAFLGSSYIRAIKIIDGYMYFACSDGHIYVANYVDESYTVVNTYDIPTEFCGLNDIIKVGNYYYISASTDINFNVNPKFIRTTDLSTIINNGYEDLSTTVNFDPYFMSEFDNKIWCTEIAMYFSNIYSFDLSVDNIISNITNNYHCIDDSADIAVRDTFPL